MNISVFQEKPFELALQQRKPLAFDSKRGWYIEGIGMRAIRILTRKENVRLNQIAAFAEAMLNIREELSQYDAEGFDSLVRLARLLENYFYDYGLKQTTPVLQSIRRKIVALYYREGKCPLETYPKELLVKTAKLWKLRHPNFKMNSNLTDENYKRLDEALAYPQFLKLCMENAALSHEFFTWILRDNLPAPVFIEFPYHAKLLKESLITQRIARLGNHLLDLKFKDGKKDLSLLINGKYISLLDKKRVVAFGANYKLKIEEILHQCAQKKIFPGDLEFFQKKGLYPWRAYTLEQYNSQKGKWEKIHLASCFWWEKLPLFEELTRDQIKKRYLIENLSNDHWIFVLRSTRSSQEKQLMGNHSFFKILIPKKEKGIWKVLPFGKYPFEFPSMEIDRSATLLQKIKIKIDAIKEQVQFLALKKRGTISYPDENVFMLHREHYAKAYLMTHQEGLERMERIRKDLQDVRQGRCVFQFGSQNCAEYTQSIVKEIAKKEAPDFKKPFFSLEFGGLMGRIICFMIRFFSDENQVRVLMFIGWALKADSEVMKKLLEDKGKVHYPAAPFYEHEEPFKKNNLEVGCRQYYGSPITL